MQSAGLEEPAKTAGTDSLTRETQSLAPSEIRPPRLPSDAHRPLVTSSCSPRSPSLYTGFCSLPINLPSNLVGHLWPLTLFIPAHTLTLSLCLRAHT